MLRVFCDFDGTVASNDVGNLLFRTFAGDRAVAIVKQYLDGFMNARDCLSQECAALGSFNRKDLESFVDGFRVDPAFVPFVGFCEANEIPVVILSDGLDFYVSRLLNKAGLGRIPFFANHAVFSRGDDGKESLAPEFPYRDEHCDQCGNCKRNHVGIMSADEDIVAYVGDGISDRCPVRYADIVFAKKDLIKYCQQQNISYFEYENFSDVHRKLAALVKNRTVKPRREAVMARRDLFIAE